MKDLSLHILDLSQNSVSAGANLVNISIVEDTVRDLLTICIEDNGKGMDKDFLERVKDPFVTTRTSRKVGLGIPLMQAACMRCEGDLLIESEKNVGTKLTATFKRSHIDRAPIGNIAETMMSLILAGCNESSIIDFVYRHVIDDKEFCMDTREIRRMLGSEVSLGEPDVLMWIKDFINEGMENLRGGV
ncbi:MAG TPA: ATP-binding protein [Negativicutes bacterium]|nr:ATP-binding protein [Negativicutes bacterium]